MGRSAAARRRRRSSATRRRRRLQKSGRHSSQASSFFFFFFCISFVSSLSVRFSTDEMADRIKGASPRRSSFFFFLREAEAKPLCKGRCTTRPVAWRGEDFSSCFFRTRQGEEGQRDRGRERRRTRWSCLRRVSKNFKAHGASDEEALRRNAFPPQTVHALRVVRLPLNSLATTPWPGVCTHASTRAVSAYTYVMGTRAFPGMFLSR